MRRGGRIWIRAAFAVLALLLTAGLALSQTIAVQSGEHAGFTRLVLDIGAGRDWSLSGEGETRQLALDPPVEGFAIARVFDLIPRTRLAALEAGEALTLMLACPCDIRATRHRERYLILDIAEADPAPAPDGRPAASEAETVRRQAAAESLPDMTRLLTGAGPAPAEPASQPRAPVTPTATDPGEIDMAEAARIMAEQLARAAASGLLEAAPGRPMSDADPIPAAEIEPPEPAPDPVVLQPRTPPDLAEPAPPARGAPLRAETALDAALHRALRAGPQRNQLGCAGVELSLRDWSAGDAVQHGLGALRLALHDDRDQLQRDAALALARHYLAFGFGAEAAHWLGQIDMPPPDLMVIAALVDARDGPHFPPEPDPLICSEEELLWRYLDGALGAHPLSEEDAGRLQRATAALPIALRDQIAPRIARRLQADGHPLAARNLRDVLQRGGRLSQGAMVQLDRDLGFARAGDAATGAALEEALRVDGADPVGAMTHALAFDRESGLPGSEIRLDAAEALLREHGLGPETGALWQEVVLAHAGTGALDRIVEMLAAADAFPEERRDAALTALISDRVAAQDIATLYLLARLHGASWRAEGSEAGRARVGAIAQLREAGLGDAAERLRAGQRLLILPARPGGAPNAGDALRSAWQGGDWAGLAAAADGPHRGIARRMLAAEAEGSAAIPMELPALAARIADSRDLRAEVAGLLAAPAPRPRDARE